MARECVICGRGLRTGRKYCYEHRGYKEDINIYEGISVFLIPVIVIFFVIVLIFITIFLQGKEIVFPDINPNYTLIGIISIFAIIIIGYVVLNHKKIKQRMEERKNERKHN